MRTEDRNLEKQLLRGMVSYLNSGAQFRYRPAEPADAAEISAVWQAAVRITCAPGYGNDENILRGWADSKTPETVALLIEVEDHFTVAEDETGICGFYCATFSIGSFALYVRPDRQRMGIGARLFRSCVAMYMADADEHRGGKGKDVFRFYSSLNAVPFYRKQGAVIDGAPVSEPYPAIPMKLCTM